MKSRLTALGILALLSLAFSLSAGAADVIYVQAAKVDLKDTPKMNGASVAALKRGDTLTVLKTEGVWYQVQAPRAQQGWVSKLFTSTQKPVGAAELASVKGETLEKASRRRSSSFSVSASTRGLMAESRTREGREQYQSDFDALQEVENYQLKDAQIEAFKNSASLR